MTVSVILTLVGSDRPGLTNKLAEAVHAAGGNWLESQLARLGGKYVGSVLVEIAEGDSARLEAAVNAIDPGMLTVTVIAAAADGAVEGHALAMELVGADRPGIVREVTTVLAGLNVNIEDFDSTVDDGAWSGERIFRARASLTVPDDVDPDTVIAALEAISGEIMVDLTVLPTHEPA
ncbi:MAG: amino acid-binding protein [Sphingomonas sp. 28-62-20]|uniref:glycine cleavage system protein R n=1 Tax=Sphingomonas sp. 28-62-20 TaxID=1970433 RepID=UPI000AF547A7|nr:MAG: amino acid-binding protein [Sphingomonas sp. 28-62-20]